MKEKVLFFMVSLLLLNGATEIYAQTSKCDTIREGNLVYIKKGNSLERFGNTQALKAKSYEYAYWQSDKQFENKLSSLLRAVFPKERVAELSDVLMGCGIIYSPVDNKIVRIFFSWSDKEGPNCPVTLTELDKLERKLRSEPNLFPYTHFGEIVEHGETIGLRIRFKDLYK